MSYTGCPDNALLGRFSVALLFGCLTVELSWPPPPFPVALFDTLTQNWIPLLKNLEDVLLIMNQII